MSTDACDTRDARDVGAPVAHDHVRRLVAVHLEDGSSTRELACETCGAVWFT